MGRASTTSDVFNAIAEPRRRAILTYVADGERSVGDIARYLRLGQPSASKHLAVLKEVNLVTARQAGRRVLYRTEAPSIQPIHEWAASFERYWIDQLNGIKEKAERFRFLEHMEEQ